MARRDRSAAYHPLVRAVAEALTRRCGITPGAAMVVAVSGGADSVALLRALAILAPRRGWGLRLTVAHVQHHLRADRFAEKDARFVARMARRLALPIVRADLDPCDRAASGAMAGAMPSGPGGMSSNPGAMPSALRGHGATSHPTPARTCRSSDAPTHASMPPAPAAQGHSESNLEAWARRARYEALAAIAHAADAPFLAVAHHADDQLETLLMRLLRGASLRGLSAMRWRRRLGCDEPVVLIRPMLAVDRALVEQFLADLRQPYCQDHTNRDVTRLRARLRRQVTPELKRIRPDVARQAVRLTDRLRQAARQQARAERLALERFAWTDEGASATFDRATARGWPALILTGALRRALVRLGAPADKLTARALAPIVRAARDTHGQPRRFALAQGVTVVVQRRTISLSSRA